MMARSPVDRPGRHRAPIGLIILLGASLLLACSGPGGGGAEPDDTTPTGEGGYDWDLSLSFDPAAPPGTPSPNMGMNIVAHAGALFLGTSTNSETAGHSLRSSYVWRKTSPDAEWTLDATFEPRTERVGAMESVTFTNDGSGRPLPGGPVQVLVAATNQNPSGSPQPVKARTRDDTTGRWVTSPVSAAAVPVSQVREIGTHRDAVTGADLVFVAASPAPLGIYSGAYDASAPGRIRWGPVPEVDANSDRASEKWFGMDESNGALYASNNTGVFRRIDGPEPRWDRVGDAAMTGVDPGRNPEWRGLTSVPNPTETTGWPEPEMLIFSYGNAMWRMRAGGDHEIVREYDLRSAVESLVGEPVPLAEAAFNRLNPVTAADGSTTWLVGFQFATASAGRMDPRAFFAVRDEHGRYRLDQVRDPDDGERELIVARDIVESPFPHDAGTVYATGYNASASTDDAFLGRAWVIRGTPVSPTERPS